MISLGDMNAVSSVIIRLGNEIKQMINSALEISYFSRGGWSYEAVLNMSAGERDLAVDLINERLKQAAKMKYPVF